MKMSIIILSYLQFGFRF